MNTTLSSMVASVFSVVWQPMALKTAGSRIAKISWAMETGNFGTVGVDMPVLGESFRFRSDPHTVADCCDASVVGEEGRHIHLDIIRQSNITHEYGKLGMHAANLPSSKRGVCLPSALLYHEHEPSNWHGE